MPGFVFFVLGENLQAPLRVSHLQDSAAFDEAPEVHFKHEGVLMRSAADSLETVVHCVLALCPFLLVLQN